MTGIQTKLEYLQELEKTVLKALQAITDCNDLVEFGIDNGFDIGCGGDVDSQLCLEESLADIRKAIETLESEDPEAEADLKDYLKSIDDAYDSAKAGSK